jgi:hypothetical protein
MRPPQITADDLALAFRMHALHKRTGATYAGDPATGRIERISTGRMEQRLRDARAPIIHVPKPRENQSRQREHRSRSRTRPTRGSPDDPEPEPPLRVIPLAAFRRELRRALEARPA